MNIANLPKGWKISPESQLILLEPRHGELISCCREIPAAGEVGKPFTSVVMLKAPVDTEVEPFASILKFCTSLPTVSNLLAAVVELAVVLRGRVINTAQATAIRCRFIGFIVCVVDGVVVDTSLLIAVAELCGCDAALLLMVVSVSINSASVVSSFSESSPSQDIGRVNSVSESESSALVTGIRMPKPVVQFATRAPFDNICGLHNTDNLIERAMQGKVTEKP
uniref:Uncharacterized protein n=1 Tax=Glossina austeni TaxID=7395 RepID=A0A1A9V7J3_GLOAU